jgi:hypothetical protein
VSDAGTPLWRWLIVGGLCTFCAVYFVYTGEIAIDKKKTMFFGSAANPIAYWLTVVVLAALGIAALRKAWKQLRLQ